MKFVERAVEGESGKMNICLELFVVVNLPDMYKTLWDGAGRWETVGFNGVKVSCGSTGGKLFDLG